LVEYAKIDKMTLSKAIRKLEESGLVRREPSEFVPYRRDINFLEAAYAPIHPLMEQLSFIKDKSRWGYAFQFGHLEIAKTDFETISTRMLGRNPAND